MKYLLILFLTLSFSLIAQAESSGKNPRMEPFFGDVNKATPTEKLSIYYILAEAREKKRLEELQKIK